MLTILFSPSEGKHKGGNKNTSHLFGAQDARKEILDSYNTIIQNNDKDTILSLFGIKKYEDAQEYIHNIYEPPFMYAIERYSGVAYEYLSYHDLETTAQEYLKEHTMIFSNLYGPIQGKDTISNYKVKQGNSIGEIAPDKFYKERFSYQLDLFLSNHDILDLRAGYYDKFYKPNKPFTTLKFLKNGKTVSHWAKAYRGIVLREIAKAQIDSLDDFMKLELPNLSVQEIKKIKNKTEIVFNITE